MDVDAGRVATGYFWSILAMMSSPFLILGLFIYFIRRSYKAAQGAPNTEQA